MINCKDFLDEIGNYLEGDVAEGVRIQLEHHLARCQTCTVICDSARKTLKIVTDSDSFDLSPEVFQPIADEIMARIRKLAG